MANPLISRGHFHILCYAQCKSLYFTWDGGICTSEMGSMHIYKDIAERQIHVLGQQMIPHTLHLVI